jgi:hypothetical protein
MTNSESFRLSLVDLNRSTGLFTVRSTPRWRETFGGSFQEARVRLYFGVVLPKIDRPHSKLVIFIISTTNSFSSSGVSRAKLMTVSIVISKNHTFATLSRQYGLSTSSLFRHKQHLALNLRRARQRLEASQQHGCLLNLNAILDQVQRAIQTAETDGNVDKVLQCAHVGSRIIHQINQMDVPLELDTVYRLISSPQWVSQDSLLPTDPQIITGIHQALADIALFPCPDPLPETADAENNDDVNDNEADDYEEAVEVDEDAEPPLSLGTRESELETLVQQLLARLSLTVNTDLETTSKNTREKSAKLPKNRPFALTMISEINKITCAKKISRKTSV